jgi:uncharacterized protein
MNTLHVVLSGIVGSTAYGLAGPDSDVDRLGIYAAPTMQLLGLHKVRESIVQNEPDVTMHELGKFVRLVLAGNPTVVELLWLPTELYETVTPLGFELVSMRSSLLCAPRVRDAYLGYATQQFKRLETRGDGSFSADTRNRTAKHGRHLARLLFQGLGLYVHGQLMVRLPEHQVEQCRWLGDRAAAGNLDAVRRTLAAYEAEFNSARSPLPDRPDTEFVDKWLRNARRQLLSVEVPDVPGDGTD